MKEEENKATCKNCGFEWVLKGFMQKVSCPCCGENELIFIGEQDAD